MFNGLRIKELLEERGIQQNIFTLETGISKSNYWVWVEGKSKPGADKLEIIADYFKVPIDYFFDRETNLSNTSIGHHVNGNGNKVSGDITLSEYKKEIEHLTQLLREKQAIIDEKERTNRILMKQR